MKILSALFLLPLLLQAEVTARFIPLSLASSAPKTGPAAEAGTWHIEVCNWSQTPMAVSRVAVFQSAPTVRYLPEAFQQALTDIRTKRHPLRVLADVFTVAGSGVGIAGLATGSNGTAAAGTGVAVAIQAISLLTREASSRAPAYTLPKPIPETLLLGPFSCFEGDTLAARVSGAATIGPNEVRVK